ncbi:unnamed protein product [Tilletia controversa]|uniref:peptide-methionine (S)-S-oxide reductase n=3 Tax=Tilletia TaxID=13289 RepID=A0A8X7MTJ9_9BASI|nr:hypothetical protein CF336_g3438 [Tilletia laevis]KAE8199791.1 hypothetical protein CF328_g3142 [Tilletia controversa]KAE8262430.1 hypothetical protein A4X03_0g2457 [Tilletia caries]KAE8248176.1 hypothetical protein A4X06_0g3910 [Tilletia controversa]CAD6887302.1 unnamed protein product [Tilletia caries]
MSTSITAPTLPFVQAAATARSNLTAGSKTELATVASGCYWGPDQMFRNAYLGKGVSSSAVGFLGGPESSKSPTYEEVCTGRTGHAEAVQLKFDPALVSYAELLEFFYRTHDASQLNRQGNDRGTQYRSAIFPHSEEQLDIARQVTNEVQSKYYDSQDKKIVTQIELRPAEQFVAADEYHQDYLNRNPNGYHCSAHYQYW